MQSYNVGQHVRVALAVTGGRRVVRGTVVAQGCLTWVRVPTRQGTVTVPCQGPARVGGRSVLVPA